MEDNLNVNKIDFSVLDEKMGAIKNLLTSEAIFNGIQGGIQHIPDQMVWTDTVTKSTFFIPILEGKELMKVVLDNVRRVRANFRTEGGKRSHQESIEQLLQNKPAA